MNLHKLLRFTGVLVLLLGLQALTPYQEYATPWAPILPKDAVALRYARTYKTSYRIAQSVLLYADHWQVPRSIAFSLVRTESQFDTLARSAQSTATGLTQVVIGTARVYDSSITSADLHDPDVSLNIGFWFLNQMHTRYRGDWWRALVAYHSGPGVADTLPFGFHMYADHVLFHAYHP